ncbi:MAG: CDP-diacylglycerol--glycerol-3-phosphate 3-phosphatidyltransferase [Clostridia bacterium]|nr:CDP-diacylglycerol--glycerol-3-phosphate 3-phosphatidyltransferase [Clostridia bacterium]
MNTPNKLTVARIIATPFFMAAMLIDFDHHFLVALILFAAASVTDLIDGKMARKHNLITDFGKFLDPLADKMLTTAAFLGFIELKIGHGITWIAFIVLLREFLITSLRLISSGKGKVIAANMWGKCKTVSQMFAIVFVLAAQYIMSVTETSAQLQTVYSVATDIVLWISAVLTVISGLVYVKQNKDFIDPTK